MIKELHEKLYNKEITSVSLVERSLKTIEEKDGEINAFITLTKERALEQAQKIDEKFASGEDIGVLAGIPCGIKDVICTKGIKTTAGSKMLEKYIAPYNATVVDRLEAAGAVSLGKLNCDEFAMGSSGESSAYAITRNPHDTTRVPGGSSSGSAASVASDEVVFSLGTDTGGSIRQPASLCGIVGLKPTYGRASRYGLMAMTSSFDCPGPLTKTVEDAAIVLSAIAGRDPKDATTANSPAKPYENYLNGEVSGLRIGIPKEYIENEGLDPAVREKLEISIEQFKKLGATIESISLPNSKYALSTYYIIMPSEVSSNMARFDGIKYGLSVDGDEHSQQAKLLDVYLNSRQEGLGDEVKRRIMLGTYTLSAGYYDAYYKKAQRVRALLRREFEEVFDTVDLIYSPTSPEVAFPFGSKTDDPLKMYLSDIYTVTANIVGIPAISFPIGTIATNGVELPVGGQLMGKWFDEEGLLRAADAYERSVK